MSDARATGLTAFLVIRILGIETHRSVTLSTYQANRIEVRTDAVGPR